MLSTLKFCQILNLKVDKFWKEGKIFSSLETKKSRDLTISSLGSIKMVTQVIHGIYQSLMNIIVVLDETKSKDKQTDNIPNPINLYTSVIYEFL